MADVETKNTATSQTLVATTAKLILSRNESRIRFYIYNTTANVLFLKKAGGTSGAAVTGTAGTYDVAVPATSMYISDPKEYNGDIWAWSTPGGAINVTESA